MFVCVITFILSFLQMCSVLYHGYTNVNIGPWSIEIQLNVFPTMKYSSIFVESPHSIVANV